jgi:hypothetical protein
MFLHFPIPFFKLTKVVKKRFQPAASRFFIIPRDRDPKSGRESSVDLSRIL